MSKLTLIPVSLDEANGFVCRWHRHHGGVAGHKFSIGLMQDRGTGTVELVGVAIVGRPVSRMLDDGLTLEVYRVATDGTKDACSRLYGACRRATFALGFKKLVTYTLTTEPGTSLRAAGWEVYRVRQAAGHGAAKAGREWTRTRYKARFATR